MRPLNTLKLGVNNANNNPLLADFAQAHSLAECASQECDFVLTAQDRSTGIELHQLSAKKPLVFAIDIQSFVKQQGTYPAPKQGAFNQALGKQTKTVIDATGGWGGDSLLMCAQGLQVTMIERHPILALLLSDAMQRLSSSQWACQHQIKVPEVHHGSSIDLLAQLQSADCIYLDPMFPPKRKKSAATNKYMTLLHSFVGQDEDVEQLWQAAMDNTDKRVVVKRPDYADAIRRQPDVRFGSKLVHYDVYLK